MHPSDEQERGWVSPHRFRMAEYHRMVDVGVLGEDAHVELLEGVVAEMTPQGRAHARVISMLGEALVAARPTDCRVRVQLPLTLGEDSEPEPDLALVTREEEATAEAHPRFALLVVEVAERASLKRDRLLKGRIYARAGIPEYWVVDVVGRAVEVHTEPDVGEGRYRTQRTLRQGEVLTTSALPTLALPVADMFA